MPGDRLPQGWEEMMQPINFDEVDFDYSWMADDSLRLTNGLRLTAPVPGEAQEAQAPNIFHNNWTPDGTTQIAASGINILTDKPFLCAQCPAAYRRLGDLTRHRKERHSAASSKYLCHIELCPRSIVGEGFGRMHHLVAHLKSNKHGMDAKEAAYMARQHNLPKSKVTGNGGLGVEEAL